MEFDGTALQQARQYLAENAALRNAVGACADDALGPEPIGVGEHNLNYAFDVPSTGNRFVLRINVARQPFHADQVGYEFAALEALERSGRTPRPVYLDNSQDAPGEGALVESFCAGEVLDFDNLRPGDLRCAAQIMADVHAVAVSSEESGLYQPEDPLRTLYEECVERFEIYRASAFEDGRITRWVERFIKVADPANLPPRPQVESAHIVNTETLPSHFIIPASSAKKAARNEIGHGRFCEEPGYFVDWERPIIGEVAQDIAYFVAPTTTFWDSEFIFDSDQADSFIEDYWRAVDGRFERGSFDARFRAFRMMTALRSATWFCRALLNYGEGGVGHTTVKTARKFPVYLSDEFMNMLAKDCFGLD